MHGRTSKQSWCPWVRWYWIVTARWLEERWNMSKNCERWNVMLKMVFRQRRVRTRHGARERSTILFKGHVICSTLSLRLSLEPHTRKKVRVRKCTVYMFLGTPSVQATSCVDGAHRRRANNKKRTCTQHQDSIE